MTRELQGRNYRARLQQSGLFLAKRRKSAFKSDKQSSKREGIVFSLCPWWAGLEDGAERKI